jgi:hypothetical protein
LRKSLASDVGVDAVTVKAAAGLPHSTEVREQDRFWLGQSQAPWPLAFSRKSFASHFGLGVMTVKAAASRRTPKVSLDKKIR